MIIVLMLLGVLTGFSSPSIAGKFPGTSSLQQFTVSGKVTDSTGLGLPGATVMLQGSAGTGTTTGQDGSYSLTIPAAENAVLLVNLVGFQPQEVPVNGRSTINITLQASLSQLEEVVVIGYGTVKKIDLTGSVGQVNVEDLTKAPVSSFAEALAGRVAGVQVSGSDGQPGGGMNIMIRGVGSLTQSTAPLYVIDGFPVENPDPAAINPEDIESMTVLKDASSTAIYGSRGANGVILIQTKRGKIGKPVVSLSSSLGLQMDPKRLELMSPYEFLKYQTELNPTNSVVNSYFEDGKTLEDYRNVEGIDWQDKVIRTGAVRIHNLAIRGGTDNTRYAISGSIFDQKGVIINTGFDRYTGRATLDQTISDKIKVGITANYSGTTSFGQQINQGGHTSGNPTAFALARSWLYRPITSGEEDDFINAPVDADAINASDFRINPFIDLENQYQYNKTRVLDGNGYLSYEISKDLIFKSTAGFRHNAVRQDRFYNSKTSQGSPYNPGNVNGINGSVRNIIARSFSNENTLNFKKTFNNDHTITGLGLFALNSYRSNDEGYGGRNLPNEELGIDGLDEGISYNPRSSNTENTMVSYATRWDYNYKSKYLLTFTFRADGSSKFNDHWGYFPGGALAWNMDQEEFFSNAFPFISHSKIRASYGSTGNNRVGDFDTSPRLSQVLSGYSFNNQTPMGLVYVSAIGNPVLRWEKTSIIDFGYEIGFLNDKISLELGLYRKTTEDLLLNATLPPSTGFGSAFKNIGKLRNEGLELTVLTNNINTGSFSWQSSFNISFNKNQILALTRGEQSLLTNATYVSQFNSPLYMAEIGKPAGMMIGFVWDGNYQYEDFDNPAPDVYILKKNVPTNGAVRNTIRPGDIRYKDLNADGIININDKTVIGRGQPIHTGGFSNNFRYKGLSLNVFFQWSYGNNIYNANRLTLEGNSNGWANVNQFASYVNRWSPENQTDANYRTRGQGPIGMHSSRVVEDGSYLRLKTVSLSYAFPSRIIQPLYLSGLSIDVSAQNVWTWTNYSGMDPEVSTRNNVLTPGYDFSSYPQARTVVVGLKATF